MNLLPFISLVLLPFMAAGAYVWLIALGIITILRFALKNNSNTLNHIATEAFSYRPLQLFLLFLFYSLISSLWSLDSHRTIDTSVKLMAITGLAAFYYRLAKTSGQKPEIGKQNSEITNTNNDTTHFALRTSHPTNTNHWQLATLFITLPLILLAERYGEKLHIHSLDKGVALYVIMAMPVFHSLLHSSKKAFSILALWNIALLTRQEMFAATISFTAGIIIITLSTRTRFLARTVMRALIVLLLTTPLLIGAGQQIFKTDAPIYHKLPESWQARVDMWNQANIIIAQHPLTGIGFDSSRHVRNVTEAPLFQVHPHNALIQIWVESGFIGALLIALILQSLTTLIQMQPNKNQVLAIIACYAIFDMFSFSIWAVWWVATLYLGIIQTIYYKESKSL